MVLVAEPAPPTAKPAPTPSIAPPPDMDQRVIMNGMTWKDYEILLTLRGDRAGARMSYLNGAIELMSPSINHEGVKTTIGRLVEAYSDERGLDLSGYGSWTLKNAFMERGLEPDECYVLGTERKEAPDLAIEVIWTSGGLNKLEIYRALGVPEVWIWERFKGFSVHLLRDGKYEEAPQSVLLPDIDLKLIDSLAVSQNQPQAVRTFRASLKSKRGRGARAAPRAPRRRAR